MTLYIIQNRRGEVLDKQLNWMRPESDNRSSWASAFASPHRDVVLNQLVELTTRDSDLRAAVVARPVDDRGRPDLSALESDPLRSTG